MTLYSSYCKWPFKEPLAKKGFLIGSDLSQEWLLPWWWENYKKHNTLPVCFIDFGLSLEMKKWCKERGDYVLLPIPDIFVKEKQDLEKGVAEAWEEEFGKRIWTCRHAWFKKPLACLQTPYETSVWIDSDCEVLGPLDNLFSLYAPPLGALIALDNQKGDLNSGVIVFEKNSPLIEKWAQKTFEGMGNYPGDQDVLNAIKDEFPIEPLPFLYNWSRIKGENPEALIIHWHGNHGKTVISHKIAKKDLQIFF